MQIASLGLVAGLNWWTTWLAVIVGYTLSAVFLVMIGWVCATYHISFPVFARASFGVYGSVWAIINRVVTAALWFGYQGWVGGQCVELVLRSWAPSYTSSLTANLAGGITSAQFLSFFLYWLIQLPVCFVTPQKIRHLFTLKAVLMPVALAGLLGWTMTKAGGSGPILNQPSTLSGSAFGWAFVSTGIMSQMNNMITLVLNNGDIARLSKSGGKGVVLPQLIALPVVFSITALIGIFISSSSVPLLGVATWNPLELMGGLLDMDPTDAATRAGVFFIATIFIIAQLATNVAANSLSFGTDLTALLPKYISIVRGQVICAFLGLLMCPWFFATGSSEFATYLSAYGVLLSPFLGILLADAYLIRRGRLDVPSLYNADKDSPHNHACYTFGVNWRAFAAYFCAVAINLPGFANAVATISIPEGLVRVYELSFFTGGLAAAIVYVVCCLVSPVADGVPLTQRGFYAPKKGEEVDWDGRPFEGANAVGARESSPANVDLEGEKGYHAQLSKKEQSDKEGTGYETSTTAFR